MEKYYLSVDGGGTKLHSLLFDGELRPVASGTGGSINPNFETLEQITHNMEQSISQCLAPLEGSPIRIEAAWASMPGPVKLYERLLRERCDVGSFTCLSEGETAIYGAGLRSGLVVLCGTGTTLFYLEKGRNIRFHGGWGSPFGDEGSGADIGCMGIRAALRSLEGWGMKTTLESGLYSFFGGKDMRESIGNLYAKRDTRSAIASVCRLVGDCAAEGDLCAQGILIEAGRKAAAQAASFLRQEGLPTGCAAVLAGGAWKSGSPMIRSFTQTMASSYPDVRVVLPSFDPVMGPVVDMAMGENDSLPEERRRMLEERYPRFTCHWAETPGETVPPPQQFCTAASLYSITKGEAT